MSIQLRDLIRNVRACKTMAEERATITKECALIRTAFKDEKSNLRHRNVAKLLFVHMLGYPSHFGQMECLKLVSGTRFSEKRIGYLGLMLLMSETEETLMLVTNGLKNDVCDKNQYIVGLALTSIGNIASEDMCRDLFPEVDKAMRSSNAYVRKKAALACVRILEKVPELIEDCVDIIASLMSDRNHAVMLTGATLLENALRIDPSTVDTFRRMTPDLVRILKSLVVNNFSPEHDVGGITDPFLQVKILEVLKVLGKGNEEASDEMVDVLAQVATNTDANKNAGNAILYACVNCIMEIESESGLKVMAIRTLGQFLISKDNNTRYIALNMLSQVVDYDMAAVQRHRGTIVDCLKDPDVSIRRRALELLYVLVNSTNIRPLAREMLNYLIVADNDVKADLCMRTASVVNDFSPDRKWHVDTMINLLQLAGNYCKEDIVSQTISLVGKEDDLKSYGTTKLYEAMLSDLSQEGLNHATIWCLGEYGNQVTVEGKGQDELESDIVALLKKCLFMHNATDLTRSFTLSAALKLTARFQSASALEELANIVGTYSHSMNTELQARSCEYANLLKPEMAAARPNALKPMPVPERSEASQRRSRLESVESGASPKAATAGDSGGSGGDLLDLADIFGGGGTGTNASPPPSVGGGNDLLSDIFGGGSGAPAAPQAPSSDNILGLFGGDSAASAAPKFPDIVAFQKHGLRINFSFSKPSGPSTTVIVATFYNESSQGLTGLTFQVAVPKTLKLTIQPCSSNSITPGGSSTQQLTIDSGAGGKLALRCKISFNIGGQSVTEMATVSKFPAGL